MLIWMKNKNISNLTSLEVEKANETLKNLLTESLNLKLIDVIFVSKDVSKYLGAENLQQVVSNFKTQFDLKGIKIIFTWSEFGAAGIDSDGTEIFVQATKVENVRDTCGAGDTFTAAVIASLMNQSSLENAIKAG